MEPTIDAIGRCSTTANRLNVRLAIAMNCVAVLSLLVEDTFRSLLLNSYFVMFLVLACRIPCGWLVPCTIVGVLLGGACDPQVKGGTHISQMVPAYFPKTDLA